MKLKLLSLFLVFSLFMSCSLFDSSSKDSGVDSPFSSAKDALEAIPDLSVNLPDSLSSKTTSSSRGIYNMATQPGVKSSGWDEVQSSLDIGKMGSTMVDSFKEILLEMDTELEFNTKIQMKDSGSIIIIPVSETTVNFNVTFNNADMPYLQVSMIDLGDEEYEATTWILKNDGTVLLYSIFNTKTGESSLVYNFSSISLKQVFTLVDDTLVLGQSFHMDSAGEIIDTDSYAWGSNSYGAIEVAQTATGSTPYTFKYSEYYDGNGNMIYGRQNIDMFGTVTDSHYYALNYLTFKSAYSGYTLNRDSGITTSYEVEIENEDGSVTKENYDYLDYDWWIENDNNDSLDSGDIDLSASLAEMIIEKQFYIWDEDKDQFLSLICNMLTIFNSETSNYFDVNSTATTSISASKTGINENITDSFKSKLITLTYPTDKVPEITEF